MIDDCEVLAALVRAADAAGTVGATARMVADEMDFSSTSEVAHELSRLQRAGELESDVAMNGSRYYAPPDVEAPVRRGGVAPRDGRAAGPDRLMARISKDPGPARMTPAQKEAANRPRLTCTCGHSEHWHAERGQGGSRTGRCAFPRCKCLGLVRA